MLIHHLSTALIGNTPMLQIKDNPCRILCKLESKNPGGSVKDRVALSMIEAAEQEGLLVRGSRIFEATSGNTGIGLCAIAAAKGYPITIVMPENMSIERQQLMAAYGAQVILSPAAEGMEGAVRLANTLAQSADKAFIPGQFDNPANPQAHYDSTGPEIWRDTEGRVDIFVAGIGTGGTVTGVGRFLKEQNPNIQVIGVEPAGSAVLSGKPRGAHRIQGIGAGFVPKVLNTEIYDEILPVDHEDAYAAARLLGKQEGILTGISSGAALHGALLLAKREENAGKTIVALLPDTGDRYLSTPLYL